MSYDEIKESDELTCSHENDDTSNYIFIFQHLISINRTLQQVLLSNLLVFVFVLALIFTYTIKR